MLGLGRVSFTQLKVICPFDIGSREYPKQSGNEAEMAHLVEK